MNKTFKSTAQTLAGSRVDELMRKAKIQQQAANHIKNLLSKAEFGSVDPRMIVAAYADGQRLKIYCNDANLTFIVQQYRLVLLEKLHQIDPIIFPNSIQSVKVVRHLNG